MSWPLKESLQQVLAKESGTMVFSPGQRRPFALAYPNSYYVGMSNLGFHIIYQQINQRGDMACERFFLPEKKISDEYRRTNTSLMSIENQRPLYEFPLIGFAVTFEMDEFHLPEILALGKVEILANERGENEPIVIAGGPCATFNPEPMSLFVDVFIIGEGEETIHAILDAYEESVRQGESREGRLLRFANLAGVYVPRFYVHTYEADGRLVDITNDERVPAIIDKQWIRDLDRYEARTVIVTDDTEFKDLYLMEIARGCGRHCRFCMAGYCFRKPRNRSLPRLEQTLREAKQHGKKIGLMGAAISDYPEINALCDTILAMDMRMSVASFRADSVTESLVNSLAASGLKTLTLAPEAGSERMREVINKGIRTEHLFHAIALGARAGIANFRLYIMIGLPFEEDEDIEEILRMTLEVKSYMTRMGSKGLLTLSVNPFIPKPFTPFQWLSMDLIKNVERKFSRIKNALKGSKGIDVLCESPKESYIQGILARGDRQIGRAIYDAHCMGGKKFFKKAMKQNGLDETAYLYRQREENEVFPWTRLNMGFDRRYLYSELQNAKLRRFTPRCFDGCKRCGVCDSN